MNNRERAMGMTLQEINDTINNAKQTYSLEHMGFYILYKGKTIEFTDYEMFLGGIWTLYQMDGEDFLSQATYHNGSGQGSIIEYILSSLERHSNSAPFRKCDQCKKVIFEQCKLNDKNHFCNC